MGKIEKTQVGGVTVNSEQPKTEPQPKAEIKQITPENPSATSATTKIAGVKTAGAEQRDRIERLYGAGAAGLGSLNDARLRSAQTKADNARHATFNRELTSLKGYEAQMKAGADVSGYKGAKNFVEVAQRADNAYRTVLKDAGFTPADVRGTSVVKAADFLNAETNRKGGFSTLSADQVRGRVQNGDAPSYVVRLVKNEHMKGSDATLAFYKNKQAWVATADELAGAKTDLYETMKRIGYEDSYISEVRQNIEDTKAGKFKPGDKEYSRVEDYSLAVVETTGTKGRTTPLWDTIIDRAKSNTAEFGRYDFNDSDFANKVKDFQFDGMDYDAHRKVMNSSGIRNVEEYTTRFPPQEAKAFEARFDIENKFGANPLYTGDGTTLRPDTQNGGVGAREYFVDNIQLQDQQRATFVPMQDRGLIDNPTVEVRSNVRNVVENPLRLRGEMRSGAIMGGTISAVTSLPEVFEKAQQGDYAGAAQTFATRTGGGAFVGATSAAGERIIGRSAEKILTNSPLATRAFEKLSENGVANRFASRLISSETSAISSGAFTGVARQVLGRVAGGSIIGGVVNGAFSAYDQIGAFNRGEVTGSQAIGTITGEVGIGLAAGATGAAAGALIGSVIPIAGTAVGAVVGFVVGVGVGMATDYAARHFGADKFIARNVTALIDNAPRVFESVKQFGADAAQSVQTAVTSKIAEARQVVNRISDAGRTAQTFINQKVAGAKQKFSQATEAATQFVSQAKRQVGQTVNRAVNAVQNRVNQVVNRARAVTNRVSNAARTAQTFVNQSVTRARQTVSRATNAVSNFVAQTRQNVTNTVRSAVSNAATRVQNTVNNAVSNARATVSNAVSNFAGNAVGNLKSVFGW